MIPVRVDPTLPLVTAGGCRMFDFRFHTRIPDCPVCGRTLDSSWYELVVVGRPAGGWDGAGVLVHWLCVRPREVPNPPERILLEVRADQVDPRQMFRRSTIAALTQLLTAKESAEARTTGRYGLMQVTPHHPDGLLLEFVPSSYYRRHSDQVYEVWELANVQSEVGGP